MKQHVTPKQLSEISIEQCCEFFETYEGRKDFYKYNSKKMTIGKMIEILGLRLFYIKVGTSGVYNVSISEFGHAISDIYEYEELCDALWEAVKELL